ncbi:MAG: potassium transporter TrkG [Termitinemataceae bacterium]|nr:MAG: potassium transporter TrkG [Termitinemataceae bacterium]
MRKLKLFCMLLISLGFMCPLLLVPLIYAAVNGEQQMIKAFAAPLLIAFFLSVPSFFTLKCASKKNQLRLRSKDGFLLVTLTWFLISLLGMLPYYLSIHGISFADAIFESCCGFATTGGSTFANIEVLSRSLLLWRSITHWAGGIGIVVLSVALLPILGVGGFQLIKAEISGPDKEQITPKIAGAAKMLCVIYFSLTLILFVLYLIGGMPIFDAVCHSFAILATGGVSTKNIGLAAYKSPFIEIVTTIFMFAAAFNFSLYIRLLQKKPKDVFFNTEARTYIFIFIAALALITYSLIPTYGSFSAALRFASFNTASIISTTGSSLNNYDIWNPFAKSILLILMLIGGCSGSTACGIKMIRISVLFKQAANEIKRLIYPRGVFSIRLNNKVGRKDVVYGVAGFVFLYLSVIAVTTIITAGAGIDMGTSFSAAIAVTSNVGIAFAGVAPFSNYSFFPDHIKLLFSLVMIASRLEFWSVIVLFTKDYWRN